MCYYDYVVFFKLLGVVLALSLCCCLTCWHWVCAAQSRVLAQSLCCHVMCWHKIVLTVCCLFQALSPAPPPLTLWAAWPVFRPWVTITFPRCPRGSPLTDSGEPLPPRAWMRSVRPTPEFSNTQVCPVYSLPQEKVGGSFLFQECGRCVVLLVLRWQSSDGDRVICPLPS